MSLSIRSAVSFASLALFAGLMSAASAQAQSAALDGLTAKALEHSPAVQSKKAAYEAARARVIGAWLPPDPEFGVDVEGQSALFRFDSRMNLEYMAEQRMPFPTTLWLRAVQAAQEADRVYEEFRQESRDTVWHVEQPYFDLFLAKRTLAALEESQTLIDQLQKSAKARYESAQGDQNDLLRIQVESSRNAIEVVNTREKIKRAQAHFAHILDEPIETQYEVPGDAPRAKLSQTLPELVALAEANRPELKAFQKGLELARTAASLTKTQWLPDIIARWEGRQYKGEGDDIRENDTFIGVSVPVWTLLKGVGGVWRSADLEVRSAEFLYSKMKNETRLAVFEAYSQYTAADNACNVYETSILPQAKQAAEVALAAYEAGRIDFVRVIDAQRTLRDTEIGAAQARADLEKALSDLRLAVGEDFK